MNKKYNLILFFLLAFLSLVLNSCKIMYPNRMFKQQNYEYFSVGQEVIDQYTIVKGDLLSLRVYSRDGFDLIDVLPNETRAGQPNVGRESGIQQISYLVEQDGFVNFPLFGRTFVLGLTENQLEELIEEKCRAIFNEPYAILKVLNRRAFIFKGSEASVVSLNEGPTTLIEVIAKSGGIGEDLKAYNIKVLRGDLSNPEIIPVDLSTMQGLQNSNLIVQSNDIIYIEQRYRIVRSTLRELTPLLALITSVSTLVLLIVK